MIVQKDYEIIYVLRESDLIIAKYANTTHYS